MKLPDGVTARKVSGVNGLEMRILEAGPEDAPLILLLHGFPELAYSWRRIIAPLAAKGYRVVAPDQRGYGGTTSAAAGYDVDLAPFGMLNLVEDVASLIAALGREGAAAVIGHDFGSPVAAWCALTRPELFGGVVMMSAPFGGPPGDAPGPAASFHDDLLRLDPPRKHYQWFYGERGAEADMLRGRPDFMRFMRAYYHCKSADWPGNAPHRLPDWSAEAIGVMPRYYIMEDGVGMFDTALSMAPADGAQCAWLTDAELGVYVDAFLAGGLQAPLNWYRHQTGSKPELAAWAGESISIPAAFVAGAQDWGVWQAPGALEAMETSACADWRGTTLIDGAGHWVQQEQPTQVLAALRAFLAQI